MGIPAIISSFSSIQDRDKGFKLCNYDSDCGNYTPAMHDRLFTQMRWILLKNSFGICFQQQCRLEKNPNVYRRSRRDLKQISTLIKFCLCQMFFAQHEVRKKTFTIYVHYKSLLQAQMTARECAFRA